MIGSFPPKKGAGAPHPQTVLTLQHLDHLLGLTLAQLPDHSFKTARFVPVGKAGLLNVYTRRYYAKAGNLFDQAEVMLADIGIKRVVFSGSPQQAGLEPLERLLDDLVIILGKDIFKKGALNMRDMTALKKGCWAGRRWLLSFGGGKRLPLVVDLMDSKVQLCLYLPV